MKPKWKTEQDIKALPRDGGDYFYGGDTPGLHIRSNLNSKTFRLSVNFSKDGKPKKKQVALGKVGEISIREARDLAVETKAKVVAEAGVQPNYSRKTGAVTFARAYELFRENHAPGTQKPHAETTTNDYLAHFDKSFADWHDVPMAELGADPIRLRERFDYIKNSRSPEVAKKAFAFFRSCYNEANGIFVDLPPFPNKAIPTVRTGRRDNAYEPEELKKVYWAIMSEHSPIRVCMGLFYLLSGVRNEAGRTAKIQNLDEKTSTLFIENTKGKEQTVVLSKPMLQVLKTARDFSEELFGCDDGDPWIFATRTRDGKRISHVVETRSSTLPHPQARLEQLAEQGRGVSETVGYGVFRNTYANCAAAIDLNGNFIRESMNHSIRSSGAAEVTAGYINSRSQANLPLRLRQQEELSEFILKQCGIDPGVTIDRRFIRNEMIASEFMPEPPLKTRVKADTSFDHEFM